MSEIPKRYRKNAGAFDRLVAGIRLDQWSNPSPCDEWDARGVVEHIVLMHGVMLRPLGRELSAASSTADDPHAAFRSARADVEAALADPAVATRDVETPMGTMTFAQHVDAVISGDMVLHSWDLARATGQDEAMPPDEVERIWDELSKIPEHILRRPGVLGPRVDVPDDAPLQDKLLGFLGRDPRPPLPTAPTQE